MLVSYEWLTDYVDTHTPARELGEKFLMTSSELEGVIDWQTKLSHVVVGEVLTCKPHPNATKLSLTTVKVGRKTLRIVCGAPNVKAGIKVLVALPGATVTTKTGDNAIITKTELRGEISEGMLCAAAELGLPEQENSGLLILNDNAKPGTPAADYLNRNTTVLDLEITPNRPDLLSYYGLAREVAAFERRSLKEVPLLPLENLQNLPATATVTSTSSNLCTRFSVLHCRILPNAHTPTWLAERLTLSGIRPIHPVVDVANYVMLELGQPLHTYDSSLLPIGKSGKYEFEAGTPKAKLAFKTLDGVTRDLEPGDTTISMQGTTIALAGIMGDAASAIHAGTKEFILESASFHGPAIRRTSRRLGVRTEASGRFEKGVDPELVVTALKRAAYLYQQLKIAEPKSKLVDYSQNKRGSEKPRIHVTSEQIQGILGVHISLGEAKLILQKLGFTLLHVTKASLDCIPPSWRSDVTREEDVLEELVRIWGYERVPSRLPSGAVKPPQKNRKFTALAAMRHKAAALGFTETIHLSFTNQRELEATALSPQIAIPLQNPLSLELSHLLPSHLISFLRTTSDYQVHPETRLFEIGSVFTTPKREEKKFSALMRTSARTESALEEMKRLVQELLSSSGIHGNVTYTPIATTGCVVSVAETRIGTIEHVGQDILERWKIRRSRNVLYLEINLAALLDLPYGFTTYKPLPIFPSIERHLTIEVGESTNWEVVATTIGKHIEARNDKKLTTRCEMHGEVYRDTKAGTDTKRYTIKLTYNHPEKTLTDAIVEEDTNQLTKKLTKLPANIVK